MEKILELVLNIHNSKIEHEDNEYLYIIQGDYRTLLRKDIISCKCKKFLQKNGIQFSVIYSDIVQTTDYDRNKFFTGSDYTEFGAVIELVKYYLTKFKASKDWANELKVSVLDPDGWDRKNYKFSFNEELISEHEFNKRLMRSTITRY